MPSSWRSKKPGIFLWTTLFLVSAPFRVAFMFVYYFPKALRQHPKWTFHQAVGNAVVRMLFTFASQIELAPPRTIEAGAQGASWSIMEPASPDFYRDILDDKEIHPVAIGGLWCPTPFDKQQHRDKRVVLHFHGGAYVVGAVRPMSGNSTWFTDAMTEHLSAIMFLSQYRLASYPKGRFPAALQDAVTSYKYLLDLGIPASQIVLSGDSAGGNIVLALLRYIETQEGLLPRPAGALLWSPWVNLADDFDSWSTHRNSKTDFIPPILGHWAYRVFKPAHIDAKSPYISPLGNPFSTKVPLFIECGTAEILYDGIREFAESMEKVEGNIVMLREIENAPHDTALLGQILGWKEDSEKMMDVAKEFLDTTIQSSNMYLTSMDAPVRNQEKWTTSEL